MNSCQASKADHISKRQNIYFTEKNILKTPHLNYSRIQLKSCITLTPVKAQPIVQHVLEVTSTQHTHTHTPSYTAAAGSSGQIDLCDQPR